MGLDVIIGRVSVLQYTYDGLPVAPEEPSGAAILVRRPVPGAAGPGAREYLMLHRAHRGPAYEGDWAWTPPSGARQPGEAVLPAALRELAEETGLEPGPAELRALDLSGPWARFGLDLPAGTHARVDPEHDRLEWVSPQAAMSRCRPAAVAGGIAIAEAAIAPAVSFRPLASADLPALVGWQRAPHVARWFGGQLDLAAAQRKYGPRIAGESPTRVHVAAVAGQDAGFLQHYRVGDYPDYAAATGLPDAVGIDYAIGDAGLTRRGLGPQLVWAYIRDVVRPAHPAARHVLASPDAANVPSIRALEKAGFSQDARIAVAGQPEPEQLCVLDLVRFFGKVAA